MDTTKLYIKMCRLAKELQDQWNSIPGDYIFIIGVSKQVGILQTNPNLPTFLKQFNVPYIWLPRQDQLQEMTDYSITPMVLLIKLNEFIKWVEEQNYNHFSDTDGNSKPLYDFHSMEQLWLSFIMKINYDKVWNGNNWVMI